MAILLGCIADDFTGGTDLANTLVSQGMRAIQTIGVPNAPLDLGDTAAAVVALKSRTAPLNEAVAESITALEWLRSQGARQFIFKYCSTFDSTEEGNIGPVADAILDTLEEEFTLVCPAFPANGRTVYKGHLFVGDALLSDSSMRNHPLTPMTDANLVRFLGHQTPNGVGLIPYEIVLYGPDAIASACKALRGEGKRFGVIDALTDEDLFTIGAATTDHRLITGGSGIALGLPENFRRAKLLDTAEPPRLPNAAGRAVVIAGSCSSATRSQVSRASRDWPTLQVDSRAVARGEAVVEEALAWADEQSADKPILIYSSATPEVIAKVQREFGRAYAGERVEQAFGRIAQGLVDQGVRRLVVAGGETSGAVVSALGVNGLRIGPEIDPGVPWTETLNIPTLALALKSGNFGGEDFFSKAIEMLP